MAPFNFDLTVPAHAYAFGFFQADGHLHQGVGQKGALTVEVQQEDAWILEQFQQMFPAYSSITPRTRDTNFKQGSASCTWALFDLSIRSELNRLGLPYGRKSAIVQPPVVPFSEPDYFRGIADANGSLGFTGKGLPFLSWCIAGPALKDSVLAYIYRTTGEKKGVNPNKRDKVYNVVSFNEFAQSLSAALYYAECLALPRKARKAAEIAQWTRPADQPRVTWDRRRWTPAEDEVVAVNSVSVAATRLNRTEKSVSIRKYRLCHKEAP